jgi:hypothetical protein
MASPKHSPKEILQKAAETAKGGLSRLRSALKEKIPLKRPADKAGRNASPSVKIPFRELPPPERERRMKVYKHRAIAAAFAAAAVVLIYCLIANLYLHKFMRRTYLNGNRVSGMTLAEAEDVLKNTVEDYTLTLTFRGKVKEVLKGSSIGYSYISSGETADILEDQQRITWLLHIFGLRSDYDVDTSFKFDQSALKSTLSALPEFQEENIQKPVNASYTYSEAEKQFKVVPADEGNELNETVVFNAVERAVRTGKKTIDINTVSGAYAEPEIATDDESLVKDVADLNAFSSTEVVLNIVDKKKEKTIGKDTIISWIRTDSGSYEISQDDIANHCREYVEKLADTYDEVSDTTKFTTTNLGVKELNCSEYGYKIDVDETADQLYQDLMECKSETITVKNSVSETASSFDGNYIEIDVTNQHVYVYLDGKAAFDSECVTGLESDPERKTPSGVYEIQNKIPDKTLEGRLTADGVAEYSSSVSYWMPFFGSYGMHDATWRSSFGGTIYKTNGSHGCVNLPLASAKWIYYNCDFGMTVVVVRSSD